MHDQYSIKTASVDMSTLIDCARASTTKQSLGMQIDALRKTGCHQVFTDAANGVEADRPGLGRALEYLRDDDTLVVQKIDYLGRSFIRLVQTIDVLREYGVGFRSFTDAGTDTTIRSGKLLFNLLATLTEFERDLIGKRTRASLAVAKTRGRSGD